MQRLTISLVISAALALLALLGVSAQEDTTPPVLLNFTISPGVFDTGSGPVDVTVCATSQDDLSGFGSIAVEINGPNPFKFLRIGGSPGELLRSGCRISTFPQLFPSGTYKVDVTLRDIGGNSTTYTAAGSHDLCPIGPCEIIIRPDEELPDSDGDGAPDDSDNCPDDPNADQADTDLDLIGDVCDPFPEDPDNEQAQCEVDLHQALADLKQCRATPPFVDADRDGEHDATDACPSTPVGVVVDGNGCSLLQFCTSIRIPTNTDARACVRSDWRNDEPLRLNGRDCRVDRQSGLCVPRPRATRRPGSS
ncbi:MAG: thrombospondin type 3 repeat-containing protein [Planctomycetota bacterium]|jgi:hypothetical protein